MSEPTPNTETSEMVAWRPIDTAPEGVPIRTKIDDEHGPRNDAVLVKQTRVPGQTLSLFWTPDMRMYVYYTPTHWAAVEGSHVPS